MNNENEYSSAEFLEDIEQLLRKEATIDWRRDNVKARLRVKIKSLFRRHNMPELEAEGINQLIDQLLTETKAHNPNASQEVLEALLRNDYAGESELLQEDLVEELATFTLEKYLEEFIISNWENTILGQTHDIYNAEGLYGRQFRTDTGPIDILAITKDHQELLVVELKKDRASDAVVGQTLRYMGYIQERFAPKSVRGAIIALEDDLRIRRALQATQGITFYKYEVKFNLKEN